MATPCQVDASLADRSAKTVVIFLSTLVAFTCFGGSALARPSSVAAVTAQPPSSTPESTVYNGTITYSRDSSSTYGAPQSTDDTESENWQIVFHADVPSFAENSNGVHVPATITGTYSDHETYPETGGAYKDTDLSATNGPIELDISARGNGRLQILAACTEGPPYPCTCLTGTTIYAADDGLDPTSTPDAGCPVLFSADGGSDITLTVPDRGVTTESFAMAWSDGNDDSQDWLAPGTLRVDLTGVRRRDNRQRGGGMGGGAGGGSGDGLTEACSAAGYGSTLASYPGLPEAFGGAGVVVGAAAFGCSLALAPSDSNKFAEAACGAMTGISLVSGIGTFLLSETGVGSLISAGIGYVSSDAADADCGVDPPSNRFTQLPQPHSATIHVPVDRVHSRLLAAILSSLLTNGSRVGGFGSAMLQCIDRASGADAANALLWAQRQHACAALYANRLASALRAQISLREAAVRALHKAHIPNTRIMRATVVRVLQHPTQKLLNLARTDKLTKSQLKKLLSLDAKHLPALPESTDAAIDGPKVLRALKLGANAFNQIAVSQRAATQSLGSALRPGGGR